MDDSKSSLTSPSFLWPGIMVVTLALYGYFTYRPPLESVRPQTPPTALQEESKTKPNTFHSRLWEDPFAERLATRDEEVPIDFGFDPSKPNKTLVLPVYVNGAPTGDAREQRLHERYAVVAALATAGYKPCAADQMQFSSITLAADDIRGSADRQVILAVERFVPDVSDVLYDHWKDIHGYQNIVVIWVPEDQLSGRPLHAVDKMIGLLGDTGHHGTNESRLPVHVIGPANSGGLLAMATEDRSNGDDLRTTFGSLGAAVRIYSPWSTVEPAALKSETQDWLGYSMQDCLLDFTTGQPKSGVEFVRVVGTDWHLAQAIRKELHIRRAWPVLGRRNECVVLITEMDTLYGRSLPQVFRMLYNWRDLPRGRAEPVVAFQYLQGIDGRQADPKDEKKSAGKGDGSGGTERATGFKPVGNSQEDYLRRLESELVRLHRGQQRAGGRGVLAIGVVGSDVYDKLLVLRAVRRRFPNACFFTTDLDANLLRPAEREFTRNLIIASHFGLELHPALQRTVPPFRTGYQTAIYLATLLAVGEPRAASALPHAESAQLWPRPLIDPLGQKGAKALWAEMLSPNPDQLAPLVFELGRSDFYQLTMTGGTLPPTPAYMPQRPAGQPVNAIVQMPSPRDRRLPGASYWIGCVAAGVALAVLFIFNYTLTRKIARAAIHGFLAAGGDLLGCLRWIGLCLRALWKRETWPSRSPGRQRPGDSATAWPWTVLSLVVLTLTITVILVVVAWRNHFRHDGEPFAWFEGISIWPSAMIRYAVVLLSVVAIAANPWYLKKHQRQVWDEWFGLPLGRSRSRWARADRCGRRGARARRGFLILFSGGWDDKLTRKDVRRSFIWYCLLGGCRWRLARTAFLSATFILLGISVFEILNDLPNDPSRGLTASIVSRLVLRCSVAGLVTTVFFAVDALQLCMRFVKRLGAAELTWRGKGKQFAEEVETRKLVAAEDACPLLTVKLIAESTNVVSKTMLYPFSLLLLMILARSVIFDKWNMPLGLVLIFFLIMLLLILCALIVRREAYEARKNILTKLRARLTSLAGDGPLEEADRDRPRSERSEKQEARRRAKQEARRRANQRRKEQLQDVIREIERIRDGAFRPLTEDYLFRYLAIPFGGAGGLLVFEQLLSRLF